MALGGGLLVLYILTLVIGFLAVSHFLQLSANHMAIRVTTFQIHMQTRFAVRMSKTKTLN